MSDLTTGLVIFGVWFLLQFLVLPRLGVPT